MTFFSQHESILNNILLGEMKHTRWSCSRNFKLVKLIRLQIQEVSRVNRTRLSKWEKKPQNRLDTICYMLYPFAPN